MCHGPFLAASAFISQLMWPRGAMRRPREQMAREPAALWLQAAHPRDEETGLLSPQAGCQLPGAARPSPGTLCPSFWVGGPPLPHLWFLPRASTCVPYSAREGPWSPSGCRARVRVWLWFPPPRPG